VAAVNLLAELKTRKKLISAFRSGGLYLTYGKDRLIFPKIHAVKIGNEKTSLTFTLPNGLNPDILKKNFYVFQQYFGKHIELNGEIKRFSLIVHNKAISEVLPYNYDEIRQFIVPHRLGVICGQDRNGQYIAFDLATQPHILIAGETGSGKSTQLRSILTTMILTKRPTDLQIYLGDCKRQEFHIFRKVEHVQCVYSNAVEIRSMLLKIRSEMEKRSTLTEVFEVGHIDDLPENKRMPYIVVCIDEFVMLRKDDEIMEILTEIVAIGRTLGVFAILSMQRPHSNVLDTTIRANLTVSMGFKLRDRIESNIVNTPKAEAIEVSGRFIMNSDKLYEIQAPYLEMEAAKALLNPFMVAKGNVKEVAPATEKLTEKDVFYDVNEPR
jgi:S-DNA-T family DNA segregation ATPase FtsK/SpoIIIE